MLWDVNDFITGDLQNLAATGMKPICSLLNYVEHLMSRQAKNMIAVYYIISSCSNSQTSGTQKGENAIFKK